MFFSFFKKGSVPGFSLGIPVLISVIMFIQGCSTTGGPVTVEDRSVSAGEDTPGDYQYGTAPGGTPEAPVVVALLDTAQQDMNRGRPESAAATLERALRLEPKNSLLWHRLAVIRQQQKLWRQALSLAQKSNSLAAVDTKLQLANWRIIAKAYTQLNDDEGAERARRAIGKLTMTNGH